MNYWTEWNIASKTIGDCITVKILVFGSEIKNKDNGWEIFHEAHIYSFIILIGFYFTLFYFINDPHLTHYLELQPYLRAHWSLVTVHWPFELSWTHPRFMSKTRVMFMVELCRLLAPGVQRMCYLPHPETKEERRMTWPGSGVRNHSQVTCVSVHPLYLEVF